MRVLPALFLLSLASGAVAQVPPPVVVGMPSGPFERGPLEGLSLGGVTDPAGNKFHGLLPSKPDASPIDHAETPAVQALIAQREDLTQESLVPFLARDVVFLLCRERNAPCEPSENSLTFGEPCAANTPYRMADGTVRVEWMYGSALYYISMVKLTEGKVQSVTTSPAWAPLTVGLAATDVPNG